MADPTFLSRAELGLARPTSISRAVVPSRGGVMVHWWGASRNITTLDQAVARWRAGQQFHMRPGGLGTANGAADIAYNLGWWRGYIFAGRGRKVRSGANGTNDANGRYLAVVHLDGDHVTDEDVATFLWIVESLRSTGAGLEVRPHSSVRPTKCPGDRWRAEAVKVDGRPVTLPAPEPDPVPEPDPAPAPTPEPPARPAPSWTETLVDNLPVRRRRTDLGRADGFDRRIQGLLAAAGTLDVSSNIQGGRLDGKFGPSTERAVRRFQQRAGIGVDGIVGRQTWTALLGR